MAVASLLLALTGFSHADHYKLKDIFELRPDPNAPTGRELQLTWTGERSIVSRQLGASIRDEVTDLTEAIFAVSD